MTVQVALGPVVSVVAGVLILLIPRLLNYIVAVYLIVIGIIGLMHGREARIAGHANPPAVFHESAARGISEAVRPDLTAQLRAIGLRRRVS